MQEKSIFKVGRYFTHYNELVQIKEINEDYCGFTIVIGSKYLGNMWGAGNIQKYPWEWCQKALMPACIRNYKKYLERRNY